MLRKLWIQLRSSLWFVPGLLVFAGLLLAVGLIEIDLYFDADWNFENWRPFLDAGAEGARGMLAAIASSMITVAGVAFSITIVTLSLASTQYTPRILRNFMRDRANQSVLGIFLGIFTYCLLVLRTIRGGNGSEYTFVPHLAVAFAVLLALLAIACLIFFIHHTAESIQASYILDAITRETLGSVDVLFPDEVGEAEDAEAAEAHLHDKVWTPVNSSEFGYLQSVNGGGLMAMASEHDLILRLDHAVGEFVVDGAPLLRADRPLSPELVARARAYFVIGDFRTVEQDAGFGIRQIVDIALKALSPGVNDTSTAVSCLDYLTVILTRLAVRRIESPYREEEGKLRVVAPAPPFADYVARAFDEIRLSGGGNISILRQMISAIRRVAAVTKNHDRRSALIIHARLVREVADPSVGTAFDRALVNEEIAALNETLGLSPKEVQPLSLT